MRCGRDACAPGCGDRLGTASSHPACPLQPTLWLHTVAPFSGLIHRKMLEMLLQESLVVFIDNTCRPAAARSFPRGSRTGALPRETSCGFCSCTPACPCVAPPGCAGVLGHSSHKQKLLVLRTAGGKSIPQVYFSVHNHSSHCYGASELGCGLVF